MATLTATAAQASTPAINNVTGTLCRVVRYAAAAALSAGDIIQMVKLPLGAVVTEVAFGASMSAGAVTVIVGDGNNKSAYAAASVLSGSGVFVTSMPYVGFGRSYSAEDTVDIEVTAVSAAPGTADIFLKIEYTMQNGGV